MSAKEYLVDYAFNTSAIALVAELLDWMSEEEALSFAIRNGYKEEE